jgi:hypothetical protein
MGDLIQLTNVETDYSCVTFTATFERNDARYYAFFAPEAIAGEAGLIFTNRYTVLMLHPVEGTVIFNLQLKANRWMLSIEDLNSADNEEGDELSKGWQFPVEKELIEWCNEQIQQCNG